MQNREESHQEETQPPKPVRYTENGNWLTRSTRLPLQKPWWSSALIAVFDIVIVLLPLPFIILGIVAKFLDGKPVGQDSIGEVVIEASKYVCMPENVH